MRDILVNSLNDCKVSVEALYMLRKAAFRQWADEGLDTSEADVPIEYFSRYLSTKEVYVVLDKATHKLLAMHVLTLDRRRGCATGSNLAVAPEAKHKGIASRLLKEEVSHLRQQGYRYLNGATAVPATWSVRWHLKNGYHITGYSRSENSKYAFYTFRKQLVCDLRHHPSDLLWTRPLAPITARLCFFASYLANCLCKDSQGRLNTLGRIVKRRKKSGTISLKP